MHFVWFSSTFVRVLRVLEIKKGRPNFWGSQFWRKSKFFLFPLLYMNFKGFVDPNSLLFIRFQCILHYSRVLLSEHWNFYKWKNGELISWVNQFCRKSNLFCPLFCISILKLLWIQIHPHSLDLNAFSMIEEYFSQSFEISTN